jgi:hypothetical protein
MQERRDLYIAIFEQLAQQFGERYPPLIRLISPSIAWSCSSLL